MSRLVTNLERVLNSARVRRFGRWTQLHTNRLAITGLIASLAFLLLVVFLATDWYSIPDADVSRSGLQIMLGLGNEDFEGGAESFGFGRLLDLMLIITPLGSLTLIVMAAMVFTKQLPYGFGIGSAVGIGLLLFVGPWIWRDLSDNDWRGDFEGELLDELLKGYRTTLPMILGFLIMLLSAFGWLTYSAHQLGLFTPIDLEPPARPLPPEPAPTEPDPED